MNGKVFGREPAVYIAVLEAALAFLVTFGLDGLSAEQSTNILAAAVALGGVLTAWATRDTLLAALGGAGKAILILGTSYGLNLSQEQVGLAVVVITSVAGVWLRTQTSPVETPVSSA
jgi:hypothetical protein